MVRRGSVGSWKAPPDGLIAVGDELGSVSENGPAREHVSEIQRARIVAAMVAVCSEHGAGHATVARVVALSGVSRRTFYEQFVDREECLLAAFDQAVEQIASIVIPAYEAPSKWREKIRAALTVLLEFLGYEHGAGRLVIVETLGAGPKVLERRQHLLAQIMTAIDQGCEEAKGSNCPAPLTADGLVGGGLSLIYSRMIDDTGAALIELLNPLVSMIVLPYLGPDAARRELGQPVPNARKGRRQTGTDPLRDLDMRLTYRTVRVLLAIGAYPGASNRQVAEKSGIRDQGQISKLLARLEHLGLIRNAGEPKAKGEPNAWELTARGIDVQSAISLQTAQS